MVYSLDIQYNELPLLPLKAEIETKAVLKKTILASRALSKFKGANTKLPTRQPGCKGSIAL